jgi:hypothetical protein
MELVVINLTTYGIGGNQSHSLWNVTITQLIDGV